MRRSLVVAVVSFVLLFTASARAETFIAYLNGAQENPPVATNGKGYARVFVNAATNTYTFTVVFEGLSSPQTLSHIHAPAAIGANAGVAINLGTVGGTSGKRILPAAKFAANSASAGPSTTTVTADRT